MRYGCVRDSHRLNVGEPVGIRQSRKNLLAKRSVIAKTIRYLDMFSGMGGFREGLTRAGDFACVGHCEIDRQAEKSYRTLFDTEGEWYCEDIRKTDPGELPAFDLLCGGFPCQSFSTAGRRGGFGDPRGTLFFELARLAEARKPPYLLFENVPGLLHHDEGRTFAAILHTLEGMGYGVEWQVLNSRDFHVLQSRKRVYLVGYLDERCRGKIFRLRAGAKPSRPFCPASDFGGRKRVASTGRLSRVETAGTHPACRDVRGWECGEKRRGGLPARVPGRLTPQECLRLQGRTDDRIDLVLPLHSDTQLYKQAGNGVTVNVVEAIGKRLAALRREVTAID